MKPGAASSTLPTASLAYLGEVLSDFAPILVFY